MLRVKVFLPAVHLNKNKQFRMWIRVVQMVCDLCSGLKLLELRYGNLVEVRDLLL